MGVVADDSCRASSPRIEAAIVATKTLNFSMTNPKAMTAIPVPHPGWNVRSLAAWSL
jgi:hypothetical protein